MNKYIIGGIVIVIMILLATMLLRDQRVALTGKISDTPWQHMINIPETHPYADYLDFDDDQMVIYSQRMIDCSGEIKVMGAYIEIEGPSKRPGSNDVYKELQFLVDDFKCLE